MSKLFRKFIKSFKYGQKGFTLIELLIVIAILGILAAVAIPQLTKFIGQSKISAANAKLGLVKSAIGAGLTDAQVSTLTAGTLSSAGDITISGNITVGNYIQGGRSTLVGSYVLDGFGSIGDGTLYPNGGTFSPSLQKFQ